MFGFCNRQSICFSARNRTLVLHTPTQVSKVPWPLHVTSPRKESQTGSLEHKQCFVSTTLAVGLPTLYASALSLSLPLLSPLLKHAHSLADPQRLRSIYMRVQAEHIYIYIWSCESQVSRKLPPKRT